MKIKRLELVRNTLGTCLIVGVVSTSLTAMAADRTGKEVVDTVCGTCHVSGKDGAPKVGNAADWSKRANQGLDKLTQNAITGVRKMPSHGGQVSLTDLEMSRAIAYMISGGTATDTAKAYNVTKQRSGEQVVADVCGTCHVSGKNGAPQIGSIDAWKPRLKDGLERLVNSAVSGHNSMPARGGMANLSDAEIKDAITFMVSKVNGNKK
jgi:cytochrome c5